MGKTEEDDALNKNFQLKTKSLKKMIQNVHLKSEPTKPDAAKEPVEETNLDVKYNDEVDDAVFEPVSRKVLEDYLSQYPVISHTNVTDWNEKSDRINRTHGATYDFKMEN